MSKKPELTRRRVLGGMATIGAASAAAGAGTMALFSDSESSNGNTIISGEMNLTLGNNVNETVAVQDLMPGNGGKEIFAVTNAGDADGVLDISVTNVQNNPSAPGYPSPNIRRFESEVTGYFDYDTHDNEVLLSEFGVDNAVTEVDLSGSGVTVTLDLPAPLGAASSGDNFAVVFDADNDGTADFQITGSAGASELEYIPYSEGWGSSQLVSNTGGITQANPDPGVYEIGIDSSIISSSSTFAFGGQVVYQGLDEVNGQGPSDGVNDRVLLTPGFNGFADSSRFVTIDPDNERTLDDLLDLEIRVDTDGDSPELDNDNDGDLMVQGKLNRIEGEVGGPAPLAHGGTKYVEVIYRLPKNSGNAVANETSTFDLDLTLTQAKPDAE